VSSSDQTISDGAAAVLAVAEYAHDTSPAAIAAQLLPDGHPASVREWELRFEVGLPHAVHFMDRETLLRLVRLALDRYGEGAMRRLSECAASNRGKVASGLRRVLAERDAARAQVRKLREAIMYAQRGGVKHVTTLRLPPDLLQAATDLSNLLNISQREFFERATRHYIEMQMADWGTFIKQLRKLRKLREVAEQEREEPKPLVSNSPSAAGRPPACSPTPQGS
jgi:hypothetical protein